MRGLRSALLAAACLQGGCLAPDTGIRFIDPDQNEFAVRFVDGLSMTIEDRCACSDAIGLRQSCEDIEPENRGLRCPVPPVQQLPRFMNPDAFDGFDFCGCPEGERDSKALPPIDDIWVEDLDVEDGTAKDSLYAALLLDLPNDPFLDASDYVAYRQLLNPDTPLQRDNNVTAVIPNNKELARPEPRLRRVVIGNPATSSVDFCNDAGIGGGRLDEGWHTITLMVTDRQWLTVSADDADSDLPDIIKSGVPDVAANATWTTREWTFHCTDAENNPDCQCEAPL